MFYLIKKLGSNFLISRSLIVISASFLSNIFGYLFQLGAGRYFSPVEYGILVTLFSISGIIPLFLIFLTNGIPKLVAEIKDIDYPRKVSSLFYSVMVVNVSITIVIIFVLFAGIQLISDFTRIYDFKILTSFIFALSAGLLIISIAPFLQGLMRFKAYAFAKNAAAVLKLLVLIIVAFFGLGISSIFSGLAITTIFVGITSYYLLSRNVISKFYEFNFIEINKLIKYSLGGALGLIGITAMMYIDVILVKHYFNPLYAGLYSSLAVIGRIIFYAASPVAIVMLPICAERYMKGMNYMKPFTMSILISSTISGLILTIFILFPDFLVSLLMGDKYIAIADYLPIYGVYMFSYTLLGILTWFFIAISKFLISSSAIVAPLLQVILIFFFHNDIKTVILISCISIGIVILFQSSMLAKIYIKNRSKSDTLN